MAEIALMLPASLVSYANVLNPDNTYVRIDMNAFTDEATNDAQLTSAGIKSIGSIFKFSLTDRFILPFNGTDYVFNTRDLGQARPAKDLEGKVVPSTIGTKLLWNNKCRPTTRSPDVAGFVIDTYSFHALANMDYRITFFSNEQQVFHGTFKTQSKFTGNIRD